MMKAYNRFDQVDAAINRWLVTYSIVLLRVSLGAVFLGFGVLKFFPHVSPAEGLAVETTNILFFGLLSSRFAMVLVASLECLIGLSFLTGKLLRIAVWLLGFELIGILSPLILLPGYLFTGPFHAPNIEGQYVLKDVILASAGMVIAATLRGGHLTTEPQPRQARPVSRRRAHPVP